MNYWILTHTRKVLGTLVVLVMGYMAVAQPKGFQAVKNVPAFQQSLAKVNIGKETITSDFIQIKNMALLAEKIKSKGKFYYKKADKVRIEYTTPYSYLVVMNNGQMMVKDEQKTNKINTKNSKTLQSVNRIIVDCMTGSVFNNPDFKVNAYESSSQYLMTLMPATDAMKKMFRQIEVNMEKADFDVAKLTMTETGGDLTVMEFSGTKHNTPLNETLFKVK